MKISLIHWSPIELFPPAMNMARVLVGQGGVAVTVHTTAGHPGHSGLSPFQAAGVTVCRAPSPVERGSLDRALAYGWFQAVTLVRLVLEHPSAVVYVEPSSAFPVWLYSWLRPQVPVFIHHHEYHSVDQFDRPGMRLIRWFHALEKKRLFPRARWVSHTNAQRWALFARDCPEVSLEARQILPNYPPGSWSAGENTAWQSQKGPFRFVYAGSLSLRDTFLQPFVEWLLAQPEGSVQLDVFAYNLDDETRQFLQSVQGAVIRFFPKGVDYDALPAVLRSYHAGVILYRAETLNYRYNETNKLFEYLACGLDVWFSDRLEGVRPYARDQVRPRIIECDFTAMDRRDWSGPLDRGARRPMAVEVRTAEVALEPLIKALGELR